MLDTIDNVVDTISTNMGTLSANISAIDGIVNSIPQLSEIRDEMINVQFGPLEISDNQMTIKDKSGAVIALFDLFDNNGNPTMSLVYKREVVI